MFKTFGNRELKLGLQNCTAIKTIENSCVKFNKTKSTVYKGMTLQKITEFYTK
jgi:hypothetical protein